MSEMEWKVSHFFLTNFERLIVDQSLEYEYVSEWVTVWVGEWVSESTGAFRIRYAANRHNTCQVPVEESVVHADSWGFLQWD